MPPMPTECSAPWMGFAAVEGRAVVADFDGGAITSDAGALLLDATDQALGLVETIMTNSGTIRSWRFWPAS